MLTLAMLLLVSPPEYLTEVASPVIETSGSAPDIAAKGRVCIAQQLAPGRAGGQVIVSDDVAAGVVVATNTSTYRDGLINWTIRSRVTFEAREGRFRITQSALERFNEMSMGWSPIGKWRGSGWQKAEAAFQATSTGLSNCVVGTAAKADW